MPSKAVALALSTHPGPTIAVTLITAVLGIAAEVEPARLALLTAAVLANQVSVGWSNDWIDAARDRSVGRTDKPVARGDISAKAVRNAAIISALLAIALTLPLGAAATVTHTVFIISAWLYNAGLKNTAASVVPYIVSFGLLPLVVTASRAEPAAAAWWAMAAGACLGVAAHFANVLPDLDDDKATGVSGLPHRMGRTPSGITTYLFLMAASCCVVFGAGATSGAVSTIGWVGLVISGIVAATGIILVLTREPSRLLFQLIIVGAIVNVTLLAFAGNQLVLTV
ncbi:MAG TPA: UbiA family prenyltransferase [Glaciihabitans sp.]|nr:UbiA family prenyltransferase [Glaciihabitans sp.]